MLNPGFEREAAGFPIEWSLAWGKRANCTWANDAARTGEHSLKLTGAVCVQSPAFPYDGEVITVSGWLKLDRLAKAKDTPRWFTAGIVVISLDKDRKPNGHKDLVRKVGTQEWTRYERRFTFAHTTKYVRVQLLYAAKCTGTAWFDDIEIVSAADTFKPPSRPFDRDQAVVSVDASQVIGPLPDLWRHIDNSYMTELVRREKASLLPKYKAAGFRGVRMHETIHGPRIYREIDGNPVYNWRRFDAAIDLLMEHGLKPYITLESTPNEMAAERVNSYRNISKVVDLDKWQELVFQIVKHCVERYGRDEVCSWTFELWNEPDASGYYKGTLKDYLAMYDHTVAGATRAEPGITIGACGGAGNGWILPLAEHCANGTNAATGRRGTRIDFFSWHIYCSGGGVPYFATIERSIRQVDEWLARFPQYRDTPRTISEWSCNSSPADWLDTSYRAPFLLKAILKMDALGIERCHSFVTCEYLWNNDKKLFQRSLGFFTCVGVPKAPFHLFTLLTQLTGSRVAAVSSNDPIDALAAWDGDTKTLRVLMGNYVEAPQESFDTQVTLKLTVPALAGTRAQVKTWRVTPTDSNAYDEWATMGKPQITAKQWRAYLAGKRGTEEELRVAKLIDDLRAAAALAAPEVDSVQFNDAGASEMKTEMPVSSVYMVEIGGPAK